MSWTWLDVPWLVLTVVSSLVARHPVGVDGAEPTEQPDGGGAGVHERIQPRPVQALGQRAGQLRRSVGHWNNNLMPGRGNPGLADMSGMAGRWCSDVTERAST